PRRDLLLELPVEVEQRARLRPAEVEVVQIDEPGELRHGLLVVVRAEVDCHVEAAAVGRAFLPDADRCRLLPAPVAAGRVPRLERPQEATHERLAAGGAIGVEHRAHHVLAGEDVPLDGHLAVDDAACPRQALRAGVTGSAARDVDDAQLAAHGELVPPGQLPHHPPPAPPPTPTPAPPPPPPPPRHPPT